MSDKEALIHFERQPVSSEMVHHLVNVTNSLIKVKPSRIYPSPPSSPASNEITPLFDFICGLVKYSNVQTSTLMSSLVYLIRLKKVLPPNIYGIETTHHRIFMGCLILAAKFLNDSCPINKHWAKYTDGLLSIQEINTIERELLEYLNWDLIITNTDLINSLSVFLTPIKQSLQQKQKQQMIERQEHYIKASNSSRSLGRPPMSSVPQYLSNSNSTTSITSSVPSLMSSSSSRTTLSSYNSSNSIHQSYVKESIDQVDYYTPTKPLRVRNLSENTGKKAMITKSNKSFNLMNAGSPKIYNPKSNFAY